MDHQAFSKIWILIILAVFIAGGIFAWQYFGVPEEAKDKQVKIQEFQNRSFITVFSPNGREEWQVGKAYEIRWEVNKVDEAGVAIFLTDQSVSPWKIIDVAKDVPPKIGSYKWIIPSHIPTGNQYKVLITGVFAGAQQPYRGTVGIDDESNNFFSIF